MKHKEAIEKIQEIERQNRVWSFRKNNFYIWPLIKHRLFEELIDNQFKKSMIISRLNLYSPLNLVKSYFDLKKPVNKQHIAFSQASSRHKYKEKYFDVLFDYEDIIIYEWNTPKKHYKNNYTKDLRYMDYMSLKVDILSYILSKIRKDGVKLNQLIIAQKKIDTIVRQQLVQFELYYKEFMKFFKKNKAVKKIYFRVPSNPRHIAMICVARQLGITTIELQHGVIYEKSPVWDYTSAPKRDIFYPFSDFLYVYDQKTKDNLRNSKIYDKNQIRLFPFYKKIKKLYEKIPKEETYKKLHLQENHKSRKIILVSSQITKEEAFVEWIKKILEDNLITNEYIVLLKLHPRGYNLKVYSELKKFDNLYLVKDVSIYELFNIADIHSSCFSTCVQESLYWNIHNILFDMGEIKECGPGALVKYMKSPTEYICYLAKIGKNMQKKVRIGE